MLWTAKEHKDVEIVDTVGNKIDCVVSFDDETCIAEIIVSANHNGQKRAVVVDTPDGRDVLKTRVKIPGAKIVKLNS